jgi:hypothetical protein
VTEARASGSSKRTRMRGRTETFTAPALGSIAVTRGPPSTSSPSGRPSSSLSASSGSSPAAISAPSVSPSLSLSASLGSVPRVA